MSRAQLGDSGPKLRVGAQPRRQTRAPARFNASQIHQCSSTASARGLRSSLMGSLSHARALRKYVVASRCLAHKLRALAARAARTARLVHHARRMYDTAATILRPRSTPPLQHYDARAHARLSFRPPPAVRARTRAPVQCPLSHRAVTMRSRAMQSASSSSPSWPPRPPSRAEQLTRRTPRGTVPTLNSTVSSAGSRDRLARRPPRRPR